MRRKNLWLRLSSHLYGKGEIGFDGILTCTIAMMGSFGQVVALSSLSNNLNQTLASGERVLSLLEEKPLVEEIADETGFHAAGRFNDVETQRSENWVIPFPVARNRESVLQEPSSMTVLFYFWMNPHLIWIPSTKASSSSP